MRARIFCRVVQEMVLIYLNCGSVGVKAKSYYTCVAPQAAYRNCRGAVRVTDWAGIGPIGHRLSLRSQADLWPTGHTQSGLPFNVLQPRNPCNYMNYYSYTNPEGMEGWVGLVGLSVADTLPTKWSHVSHRSGTDQGRSASQRPTS